jgi:mono/diheme cytochrome c family protein
MAEEIVNSSSRMTREDLRAIATYLKSLSSKQDESQPIDGSDPVMAAGGAIFHDRCAGCHYDNGQGAAGLFPRLALSGVVQARDPVTLIRLVLWGNRGGATDAAPTAPAMPPFAWPLKDDQVASVLTFIRNSWGNAASAVAARDVASVRAEAASR